MRQHFHACDRCGAVVETTEPQAFCWNEEHTPVPVEGEPAGPEGPCREIAGLVAQAYCPRCQTTHPVIMAEFKWPVASRDEAWDPRTLLKGKLELNPCCPVCKAAVYTAALDGQICPYCGNGRLREAHVASIAIGIDMWQHSERSGINP